MKGLKLRKKRFWAMFLALVLLMTNTNLLTVLAAKEYTQSVKSTSDLAGAEEADTWEKQIAEYINKITIGMELEKGDKLTFHGHASDDYMTNKVYVYYCKNEDAVPSDAGEPELPSENIKKQNFSGNSRGWVEFTISDYKTQFGESVTGVDKKGDNYWKIKDIRMEKKGHTRYDEYYFDNWIYRIYLVPATYNSSDITYVVDSAKGTNAATNPTIYYEEKGLKCNEIADATGITGKYVFDGWYKNSDFTGDKYTNAGGENYIMNTEDTGALTLYAKFNPVDYTITYNLNGGSYAAGESNPTGYTYGIGVESFKNVSKTGYTFGGWYDNAECTGSAVTSITATQTGNVTLYAKFTVNDYTITYNLDGGTNGAANPTGYTYGTGVTSFSDAAKTGCTFGGWYANAGFTGDKVTAISATKTGNVALYAKFTANNYNITQTSHLNKCLCTLKIQ